MKALDTGAVLTASQQKEALNCLRLITRALPIVFEDPEHPFVRRVLLENTLPPGNNPAEAEVDEHGGAAETKAAPATDGDGGGDAPEALEGEWLPMAAAVERGRQAAAELAAEGAAEGAPQGPASQAFIELAEVAEEGARPLATQLVHAVLRLCFAPGLTVGAQGWELFQEQLEKQGELEEGEGPPSTRANAVWPSLLWYGGVGFPLRPATTYALNCNRQEALRCLVALMSAELYVTPDPGAPARSAFSDALVAADAPFAPTLFFSLLNAAVGVEPGALSVLPYSAAFSAEHPFTTATLCLQALLLLLNYAPMVPLPPPAGTPEGAPPPPPAAAPIFNRFRVLLASLSEPRDFSLLFRGIVTLLQNAHESRATWLPYTVRELGTEQEGVILLWKALDENRAFLRWLLSAPGADVNAVVKPLCYLLWTGRNNPARVGLINIGIFVLLLLSGERDFAVRLNEPYDGGLPTDLPAFEGSHADLLVIVLHKLVVASDARLGTLFPCMFTILNNITPYTRSLCLVAAVRLLSLLELCADPALLTTNASAPGFLNKLLLAFNNILQYQYGGNPHVVYAMVRRADIFNALARVRDLASLRAMAHAPAPPPLEDAVTAAVAPSPVDGSTVPTTPGTPPAGVATAAEADGTMPVPAPADAETVPSFNAPPQAAPAEADTSPVQPAGPLPAGPPVAAPVEGDSPAAAAAGGSGEDLGEAWVASWLPETHAHLHAIQAMLGHMVPRVARLLADSDGTADEGAVLAFVRGSTMVGLLPVPHALVMHKYTANEYTQLWFTTFLWGVVFLRNQEYPIYDTRKIKLFAITVE